MVYGFVSARRRFVYSSVGKYSTLLVPETVPTCIVCETDV